MDPSSGKGLLAACLNVFGIPVVCNDIESQESPFVTGMSTMDGIQFLESYIAANPETPVAIVLSWAPQKGHPEEHFSEAIFRFAHATRNVLAVIHISEGWMGGVPGGRVGCTDTVEAWSSKPTISRQFWTFRVNIRHSGHMMVGCQLMIT
jgi:hypothetical protein